MKIGLIDVDGHRYPNLALMKISAYHKWRGDQVEWHMGGLFHYDIVYMAKVFSSAYSKDIEEPLNADRIIKGGTGYAISLKDGKEVFDTDQHTDLPEEIEKQFPDYSIYPQYGFAVSMTSRGCPRRCAFCHVKDKEGTRTRKVADVDDYWCGQDEIKVLDSNITACASRYDLLDQYARTGATIDYVGGLDIRLLDGECVKILNRTKLKQVHFAWDNPQDDLTDKFVRYASLATHKPKGRYGMVYVLTNYGSTIGEDLYRIRTLRDLNYDPYVMVYNKPNAPKEIKDLQRWCNNKIIFGSCEWEDYMKGARR